MTAGAYQSLTQLVQYNLYKHDTCIALCAWNEPICVDVGMLCTLSCHTALAKLL